MSSDTAVTSNPWEHLRAYTPARIALGRAGPALPTRELLAFGLAHARARDAVHEVLNVDKLEAGLRSAGYSPKRVKSAAPDRASYLVRPDLGRKLDEDSAKALAVRQPAPKMAVVIGDGLSAVAVQKHSVPLLAALRSLRPARWSGIPLFVALQARVALGDQVGELLGASLVVVMIGERPGLSSPDSLGLYLTHSPKTGCTDAERNCISNVRPEGLRYEDAAVRLDWLVGESLRLGLTGTALKDDSTQALEFP